MADETPDTDSPEIFDDLYLGLRAGGALRKQRRGQPLTNEERDALGRWQRLSVARKALALGGFSVGEPIPMMYEALAQVAHRLDAERPRYLMGVGTPPDLLEGVEHGVDMFDCVLPTRNARNGQALTRFGKLVIKQARFRDDRRPIDEGCGCPCCKGGFSRAYLRHLFLASEMLVLRLISLHNLHTYGTLMRDARAAIVAGSYATFKREWLDRYAHGLDD